MTHNSEDHSFLNDSNTFINTKTTANNKEKPITIRNLPTYEFPYSFGRIDL